MYSRLAFCIAGIYLFFLTWGVLQERISTIDYVSYLPLNGSETSHSRFRYFVFLNFIQALVSVNIAWIALWWQRLDVGPKSPETLKSYLKVAISGSLASPFGYAAMRHLNYPTVILGKSCKLVPVMIMNILVYRKKFESYKYFTVALITLGVWLFMLFEPNRSGTSQTTNSIWGLFLLLINLSIDGLTNSWQDHMFIQYRMKSLHMMFFMSLFMAILLLSWLILNPFTQELSSAIAFITQFPSIIPDIILFTLCGALGQIFVFYTIEHFGSLSLVTVTVTRKLFTILISLFWFHHKLCWSQWVAVSLVFVALGLESYCKRPSVSYKPPQTKD